MVVCGLFVVMVSVSLWLDPPTLAAASFVNVVQINIGPVGRRAEECAAGGDATKNPDDEPIPASLRQRPPLTTTSFVHVVQMNL
jgi:hypothetical protein